MNNIKRFLRHNLEDYSVISVKRILPFVFILCFFTVCLASASFAQTVLIGVDQNVSAGLLQSSATMHLRGAGGATINCGSVSVSASGGKLKAGDRLLSFPVEVSAKAPVVWKNHPYRGALRLVKASGGFTVVNVIDIESYLKGVLKMEVNPGWPMEALKAQAVVARTYALRNRGKHGSSGFDLCSGPHCQVYRGVNAEDPRLSKAVDLTKGQVLQCRGTLAVTPYHSDSGGHTADVSDVWSGSYPYLRGVAEPFDYESPYSFWKVEIPLGQIQNTLAKKGWGVGTLTGVSVHSTDQAGRVVMVRVTGSAGQRLIKASHFRLAIGGSRLRSTNFSIGTQNVGDGRGASVPASVAGDSDVLNVSDEALLTKLTREGVFTADELMDMLMYPDKRAAYLRKALRRQSGCQETTSASSAGATSSGSGMIVFSGKGWGHGVGMSQWGSKALAEHGWDYRRILEHYYPGTSLH